MQTIKLADYNAIHKDYRGVWEREDEPKYVGKRTMLSNENGATVLLIEDFHFVIEEGKTVGDIRQEREDKISELFKKCGVFFAFSNEQFAENKTPLKEGEKYVSMGAGGYLPKGNAAELTKGMSEIKKWFKQATKDKKTRIELIKFELANHEAYYTGELEDTLNALGEGFTIDEVREVYKREYKNQTL